MSIQVAIVTGSNQGIGFETLKLIAAAPEVGVAIMATRNPERGAEALKQLEEAGLKNVKLKLLDLGSSDSIASFVSGIKSETKWMVRSSGCILGAEGVCRGCLGC